MLLAACGGQDPDQQLNSARAYLAKRDSRAAVIELKNVLQARPDSAEGRFLLGKALLDLGEAESASVEFRKALDLKQPANELVPQLAKSMIAERQYQRLVEQFGAMELADPGAASSLKTSLAIAYMTLGDTGKARASVAAALRAVPDDPAALIVQTKLEIDERRFVEATALLEKVMAAVPNEAQAWNYRAEILLLGNGDMAGAAQAYRKALELKPDYIGARSNLITVLLAQNDLEAAGAQVEQLRKILPNNPQTKFFEAQLAFHSKNYQRALELVQQVLKAAPDNVMVLQLAGAIEVATGALLEGERSLNKALALSPNLPGASRLLAAVYLRLGQPAKALTALQALLAKPGADAQTHSLAGEAYLLAGDLVQANASFAKAVKLDPGSTKSRTALAMTQAKTGGVDAMAQELQNIASADKGTYADLALVGVYLRNKDYARALKAIDAIEAKQPGKALAANLRGRVMLMKKDMVQARRSFERALVIDPVYIPAAGSLAMLDLVDKKPDSAKKRFESVLAVDPANLQALMGIMEIRILEGAPPDEIAGLLSGAIKRNPTERQPRLALIEHYLKRNDAKLALSVAQDAAAALPNSVEVLDALGRAQLAAGDINQAITTFNRLAGLQPESPKAYMRLAGLYLSANNRSAADQSLRRALATTPNLLAAQQALFEIALADNRRQDALAIARSVQKQRPNALVGFMMEGAADVSAKNFSGAVEVYRATLKKFAVTETATKLHSSLVASGLEAEADKLVSTWLAEHPKDTAFMIYMGEYALSRRNFELAERYFRSALALRPENLQALNSIAWIMVTLKKPGALAFIEKANGLQPNSPVLMDTLAMAIAAQGDLSRAIEVQQKAVALAPESPVLRLNLARLHISAGDKVAARVELGWLEKLGDKFAGQSEVSQMLKRL